VMAQPRDDWEKPRGKGQHLTADEIAFIRTGYKQGRRYSDVARELKCSSRVVSKYYGFFRAEGVPVKTAAPFNPAKQTTDRFYKSNFEI
jgi:hypothetical protein